MKIRIAVATHKRYPIAEDSMYLPVQAGRAVHDNLGYTGDNTGEHISAKNEGYCELTVLYWAWKNLDADYIGLCHYRRYFGQRYSGGKWDRILTGEATAHLLERVDVLLPIPRNYWIETNYSQYAHAHHGKDLDAAREIISRRYPEYMDAFDTVMSRTWGHRFNMMIMRRDILESYCSWLFDILAELETIVDTGNYTANDRRVFGFIAERLLDVWLEANHCTYRNLPVVNLERQHWPKKIVSFLRRKFRLHSYH